MRDLRVPRLLLTKERAREREKESARGGAWTGSKTERESKVQFKEEAKQRKMH